MAFGLVDKLDISTARRRLMSPRTLSGISIHPHHGHATVNVIVMNGRFIYISFHVNRPSHSCDKAIFKVMVMDVGQGQGHTVGPVTNLFPFRLT